MSFNENAFIIAGTAIAIGGVGLYIWDTRGSKAVSSFTSSSPSPSAESQPAQYQLTTQTAGKSRKHHHRRTKGKSKKHH